MTAPSPYAGPYPFDRLDVACAAYAYADGWHSGQWSDAYALFGRPALRSLRRPPDLHAPSARTEWPGARSRLAHYLTQHRAGRFPFRRPEDRTDDVA